VRTSGCTVPSLCAEETDLSFPCEADITDQPAVSHVERSIDASAFIAGVFGPASEPEVHGEEASPQEHQSPPAHRRLP
jgi:hypothetical protein